MQKIRVTAQQRANAEDALNRMWPSVPKKNVRRNLDWWRSFDEDGDAPPTCGTVACFGGWCAWWPPFIAQGVAAIRNGAPMVNDGGTFADKPLFGDTLIFMPRGSHTADSRFKGTDHALVTNRLRWLIKNSIVVGA